MLNDYNSKKNFSIYIYVSFNILELNKYTEKLSEIFLNEVIIITQFQR